MKRLKLFFACLLMAVLSIGQVWAAETELFSQSYPGSPSSYTNSYTSSFTVTTGDYTLTYANVNNGQQSNAWTAVRAGRKNNASVATVTSGQIATAVSKVSINFTAINADKTNDLYLEVADNSSFTSPTKISKTIATGAVNFTIASPAENQYYRIVMDLASHTANGFTQFNSVTFYQNAGGSSDPTISEEPVGAKYAVGDVAAALTITATPHTSGKTLSYQWYSNTTSSTEGATTVGTNSNSYTPSVASAGTTYYYCVVSEQDGGSATSNVVAVEVMAISTIAQIMPTTTAEGAEFALNDVTVTYANGKNIYVKDASGYMLVYDNSSVISGAENGKVLHGLWGKAKTYNNLPEISSITKVPTVNEGSAVEPETLNAYPTAADLNKYAVLEGVTFASAHTFATDGSIENANDASFKGATFTLRNNFKIAASLVSGKSYRVLGIVQIFNSTYQVYPITISEVLVPTMTVNPAALDFETIGVGDAAPGAKTFAVAGSNLTGDLSATVTEGSEYYDIAVTDGSLVKDANNEVSATITVTPKAAINVSAGTKTGTVTISGSGLSETVSLTTEVKAKHAINFNTGGVSLIPYVNVREGATYDIIQAPTFDPAKICEYGTFVGWTTASEIPVATVKPVLINQVIMAESDVTLYAVYSKVVGSGGTTEETADVTIEAYATANSWVSGTQYATITADENITLTAAGGGNTGKYYTTGNEWRFYQTESATLTINAGDGCTLKSATLTFGISNTGELSGANGVVTSGEPYTISGNEYEFSVGNSGEAANGQVKFTALSITYDKVDGTLYYSLAANCCTPYDITIASGIEHGSVTADLAKACEGTTVTLTFTPAGGYHLESWSVNGTAQDVAENTFIMPAEAVTVSATFAHDDCENLDAPTLDAITKSYNSATIAWNEVDDADEYAVSVVKDGEAEPVFSGNVDDLSKALENLEPETQYNYTIMAVGDGIVKCADGNGLLEGNFTTNALPTAHLTLIDIDGEHASSGDYTILTPFDLPTTAAACSKEFYGWTATENYSSADVAPEYVAGDEFTFQNTDPVTMYAVYADVTGGGASSVELNVETYAGANGWENGEAYSDFTIDGVTFTANGGGNNGKYYTSDQTWRFYEGGSVSISATGVTISSVSANPTTTFDEDNGVFSYAGAKKFKSITVNVATPKTYANYSTICAAAPEATPDPAELNIAVAGANGTVAMAYENVNTSALAVALYNDAEGSVAFTGDWLTAGLNASNNIEYTVAANTTSYTERTAYIKLTAPAEVSGPAPAVVIIPVTQAKYIPEFSSLAALVEAGLESGTDVKVSFSHILISKEIYQTSGGDRKGVYLNVKAANDEDIEIFYAKEPFVPNAWVKNGFVSATDLVATWTHYTQYSNDVWELIPTKADFDWGTDLTYEAPAAAQISVSPSGDVVFTGVDRGTSVAGKELTVTLTNVAAATATLTGATGVFSIDNETPASGEKIKISVDTDNEPNTYAAVLTISDDADEAEDLVINISITISAAETPVSTTSEWVPATDADLVDGAEVLITGVKDDVTYAMGADRGNNRGAVAASVNGEGVLTPGEYTMSFILVEQEDGKFALYTSNGKYLYAAGSGSGKNYLKTRAAIEDGDAQWTLTATSAVANGDNTNETIRFNSGNDPKIFSCYADETKQSDIALYVPKPVVPPTPVYELVRAGLAADHYYTLCFNKTMTAVQGASFWSLASKDAEKVYLVEEQVPYAAGKPYIIYAEAAGDLTAVLEGDATDEAGSNGVLYGTFAEMNQAALSDKAIDLSSDIYLLSGNKLWNVTGTGASGNWLAAGRAYIALDNLAGGVPQPAPGRRVRAIPMGQNTVTGIDELNASETPVKMIIDGQLYILRGEKMYNANGQIVK